MLNYLGLSGHRSGVDAYRRIISILAVDLLISAGTATCLWGSPACIWCHLAFWLQTGWHL